MKGPPVILSRGDGEGSPVAHSEILRRATPAQDDGNIRMTDVIAAVLESGHSARFTATGDSMYPSIRSGDALVVKAVDPGALRRGDVVLAQLPRGLTAHRIVRVERRGGEVVSITTRGDNCDSDDAPFSPGQLVGRIPLRRRPNLVTIIALARRWVRRAR